MESIGKIFLLISTLIGIGIHQISAVDVPAVVILSQNHWFQFRSPIKNCLLTDGWSKANNGKLVMWNECTVTTYNSWWNADSTDDIHFTLKNKDSGLCLSVGTDLNDAGNDGPVVQYACQSNRPATQLWTADLITENNEHWVRLKGSGGRCLSYDPRNGGVGGKMYMYDCGCCDRYHNQYFKLGYYFF